MAILEREEELTALRHRKAALTERFPTTIKRTLWTCTKLNSNDGLDNRIQTGDESQAILVSSLLVPDDIFPSEYHAPAFDLDFPCRLVPSTTPGHFHLYIDKRMEWNRYEALLLAMRDAGLLQYGFVENSIQRRQTMLLKPGLTKQGAREMGVRILTTSNDEVEQEAFDQKKLAEYRTETLHEKDIEF